MLTLCHKEFDNMVDEDRTENAVPVAVVAMMPLLAKVGWINT